MDKNILSQSTIIREAKEKWDSKSEEEKKYSAKKYKHIRQPTTQNISWLQPYDDLNVWQKNILIKGQLIRTYDSLPNKVKTHIMKHFGLSTFSSKWFRLPSVDKKILLKRVLSTNGQEEKG